MAFCEILALPQIISLSAGLTLTEPGSRETAKYVLGSAQLSTMLSQV